MCVAIKPSYQRQTFCNSSPHSLLLSQHTECRYLCSCPPCLLLSSDERAPEPRPADAHEPADSLGPAGLTRPAGVRRSAAQRPHDPAQTGEQSLTAVVEAQRIMAAHEPG